MAPLLALLCSLAAAVPASLEADPRFITATGQMKTLDYEAALENFDAIANDDAITGDHVDVRVALLLYSGAARALLGDESAARLAFESALRLDQTATLPMKTSPKVASLFDDVRERVLRLLPPKTEPAKTEPKTEPTTEPTKTEPSKEPTKTEPAPPTKTEPEKTEPVEVAASTSVLGPALAIVGGVVGVGLAAGAAYFAFDTFVAKSTADNKQTSQQDAVTLIDHANQSLAVAAGLGVAAVVVGAAAAGALALE